jgi:hypothetical protein
MSGQKVNLTPVQFSTDEQVGGPSKRCLDFVFGRIAQLLHLVETATADDADCRRVVVGLRHAEI